MTGPDEPSAEALRAQAERNELRRIVGLAMLTNPRLDPASLKWAQHWAALPRLQGVLSKGTHE